MKELAGRALRSLAVEARLVVKGIKEGFKQGLRPRDTRLDRLRAARRRRAVSAVLEAESAVNDYWKAEAEVMEGLGRFFSHCSLEEQLEKSAVQSLVWLVVESPCAEYEDYED